jgi:hypothetical protein
VPNKSHAMLSAISSRLYPSCAIVCFAPFHNLIILDFNKKTRPRVLSLGPE